MIDDGYSTTTVYNSNVYLTLETMYYISTVMPSVVSNVVSEWSGTGSQTYSTVNSIFTGTDGIETVERIYYVYVPAQTSSSVVSSSEQSSSCLLYTSRCV